MWDAEEKPMALARGPRDATSAALLSWSTWTSAGDVLGYDGDALDAAEPASSGSAAVDSDEFPPAGYDYLKSTQENYAAPRLDAVAARAAASSPHAEIRAAEIDLAYHGHYRPARERLHDRLVSAALSTGAVQPTPWLIYTAGPMGLRAGSSPEDARLCWHNRRGLAAADAPSLPRGRRWQVARGAVDV